MASDESSPIGSAIGDPGINAMLSAAPESLSDRERQIIAAFAHISRGDSVSLAAKKVGVPRQTIQWRIDKWRADHGTDPSEIAREQEERIVDMTKELALTLTEIELEMARDGDFDSKLSVSKGIAFDKAERVGLMTKEDTGGDDLTRLLDRVLSKPGGKVELKVSSAEEAIEPEFQKGEDVDTKEI